MTMPTPEQWEAEERRRSQELNEQHEARLKELRSDTTVRDNETSEAVAAVKSSDDMMREAAGIPHPEPDHNVTEWLDERYPDRHVVAEPGPIDRDALKAEIKAELLLEIGQDINRSSR